MDLKLLKSGPLPEAVRVTSSPAMAIAIAEGKVGDEKTFRIRIIDVNLFRLIRIYSDKDLKTLGPGNSGSSNYQMTPDGKYLLGENGLGQLLRWRINPTTLVPEEAGPSVSLLGGWDEQVVVSGDSKYVCLLHPGGNLATAPDHPKVEEFSTYIY